MDLEQRQRQRPLKLHFIPYLAPGHVIPLCGLATLFASRGQHVTVTTTPSYAQLLRKSSSSLHLHIVHFPAQEVGLADGVEIMSAVNDRNESAKFYAAAMMLRDPIAHFLEQHPPDCIVADFMYPFMDDVANNLGIPRLSFNGFSLFTMAAMEAVKAHPKIHSDTDTGPFVIPDFPDHITMCARPPKYATNFMDRMLGIALKSYGFIVNSFAELDGEEYIEHYHKTPGHGHGHKAWHLGPACLAARSNEERGEKSVVSENECLSWLDSKPPNSVVYVCFGSMCRFPDKQLYEMACALEQAGHPFIWVVKEKKGKENWVPKGFEEKGMIIWGWAPQLLILGHAAVGAFLTHCGWNSALEAVTAGVPMITWPTSGDQFYNERLVTQLRGIGVEVGATEWNDTGYGEREKLVERETIERAVRRLMDGGDEAQRIRRRAKEFGEKAKKALQEGGSSHNNLTALIAHLMRLRDSKPRHDSQIS